MQIGLAFRAFFALLFGRPLPPELLVLAGPPEPVPLPLPRQPEPIEVAPTIKPSPAPAAEDKKRLEAAAVQVLAVLQSEGRLLDFLSEDIESYTDADIGAAVRDVHRGLRRALADHFPMLPVRGEEEEATLTIPEGFDPAEVRLVGNVVGKPPFTGRLKHRGWRITEVRLPRIPVGSAATIVAPAEVEL